MYIIQYQNQIFDFKLNLIYVYILRNTYVDNKVYTLHITHTYYTVDKFLYHLINQYQQTHFFLPLSRKKRVEESVI